MAVVLAFEALDASDADAGRRKEPPPNYNFVYCEHNQNPCSGTSGADLMVGAAGNETLEGAGGNDIYIGNGGGGDSYIDESTSSDLYGGFLLEHFSAEGIDDRGGLDRVDLRPYASTNFEFSRRDADGDGAQDDVVMGEKDNPGVPGDDGIIVLSHIGSGRIEYIKFTDTTLRGADLLPS